MPNWELGNGIGYWQHWQHFLRSSRCPPPQPLSPSPQSTAKSSRSSQTRRRRSWSCPLFRSASRFSARTASAAARSSATTPCGAGQSPSSSFGAPPKASPARGRSKSARIPVSTAPTSAMSARTATASRSPAGRYSPTPWRDPTWRSRAPTTGASRALASLRTERRRDRPCIRESRPSPRKTARRAGLRSRARSATSATWAAGARRTAAACGRAWPSAARD